MHFVDECAYSVICERFPTASNQSGNETLLGSKNWTDTLHKQKKKSDNVHDANNQRNCDRAKHCDVRVSTIGQHRHTSCPGSRAAVPVCQMAIPAVAVIRCSWCRAVSFIRAAVGCECAVGLSCTLFCVRAGHVASGVA